jgi:sortase A
VTGRRRQGVAGRDSVTCPYLKLHSGGEPVPKGTSTDYHCYTGERPERVGSAYQTAVCLAPAYQSCFRFVEARNQPERWLHPAAAPGPTVAAQVATPVQAPKTRRRVTLVEVIVLGLGLSILLSFLFVAYAIVYRLQLRSGTEVAASSLGTPVGLRPTLVPTFTPTPLPVATSPAPVAIPDLPTPSPEPTVPAPTPIARPAAVSPPTRLVIPKIDVDIPVLVVGVRTAKVGGKERVVWADVPNAGGFHETSAYPGNPGNTVINGHRDIQGSVFRHLDKVDVGDEITLYVGDVVYPYVVTETVIVPETFASAAQRAENLKYIGWMPEERLTLVTCTPIGLATHRLLVIAKPPEQVVPQMPEAGSDTEP